MKAKADPAFWRRFNGYSLCDLYRTLETPGANRLRDAHAALDTAVRAAYGMQEQEGTLAFLLRLNLELADEEARGRIYSLRANSCKSCLKTWRERACRNT
jgi:hypothetical protein